MKQKELEKLFKEKVLKGTCFNSLKEVIEDRTNVTVNPIRALIATDSLGIWRGMNIVNDIIEGKNKSNKGVKS